MPHSNEFYAIAPYHLDLHEAFDWAVEDAQVEHGSDGMTGTIAEATRVVLISDVPIPQAQAQARAEQLLAEDDPRLREVDGPAGAIALSGGELERSVTFDRETWRIAGDCKDGDWEKPVAQAAVDKLYPGEKVIAVRGGDYRRGRHPILGTPLPVPQTGQLVVVTTGAAEHTGWLFFGRAFE